MRRPRRFALLAIAHLSCTTGLVAALGCEQEVRLFPPPDTSRVAELDASAPNIVLITLDTTRADAFGSYGQALEPTPYLDALAAEGVLFENCESASVNTLPSHATLFTGLFPFSHGVRSNSHYVLPQHVLTLAERLSEAGYLTAAEVAAPVLDAATQVGQGFHHYSDLRPVEVERRRRANAGAGAPDADLELAAAARPSERIASDITNSGIRFVEAHRDEPFFLWLHYFDPHMPYAAPPEYRTRQLTSDYHAEVMYTDAQVERFVATLKKLSLAERTLVVITSDHGESLEQHTEETHGFYVYRTTTHVPLILWGLDSLPAGERIQSLVRTADVAPTILDYASREALPDIDGVSLRPLVEGRSEDLALVAYAESAEPRITFGAAPLRAVTRGRWRYIHKPNPELYDIEADPDEAINLATREPERAESLRLDLTELVRRRVTSSESDEAIQPADAETQRQLMALGYVAESVPATGLDDPEGFAISGPDPNDLTDDLRRLTEAGGARQEGRFEDALSLYRDLLERHPTSLPCVVGLLETLNALGRADEQIPFLRRLIELDPGEMGAYARLAEFLTSTGDIDGAEQVLRLALERFPCSDALRLRLSRAAHRRGDHRDEFAVLDEAVEKCKPGDMVRNNLAFLLATAPIDELRNGLRAVELAKKVVADSPAPNPVYIDTLAASYAEVELYDFAVKLERQAIDLLYQQAADPDLIEAFQRNLEAFEAKRPLRIP